MTRKTRRGTKKVLRGREAHARVYVRRIEFDVLKAEVNDCVKQVSRLQGELDHLRQKIRS